MCFNAKQNGAWLQSQYLGGERWGCSELDASLGDSVRPYLKRIPQSNTH